jgi:hypothetical protein
MSLQGSFKVIATYGRLSEAERELLADALRLCRAHDVPIEQMSAYCLGIAQEEAQIASGTWEP